MGAIAMSELLFEISFHELCQNEGINEQVIIEVVEHGIARPLGGMTASDWVFESSSVFWVKKAIRLKRDLEIDWLAVAMLIDLLQENERLEKEKQSLHAQLERFLCNE